MSTPIACARRHDLDWVRIVAFFLLILYHVGMYYVSWDWHVKSPDAGSAIEPLMFLTSPWRLSLLFLVSGVATAFLLEKSQTGFLRQRSRRLLIPLVFGMLVVVPPQAYYEVVEKLAYGDGYLAFWLRYLRADADFCREQDCLVLPTWNHLWFVAYLWMYTTVLYGVRRLWPERLAKLGGTCLAALSGAGILLWPALFLILARLLLVGVFDATHALIDDWYNHAQYFPVFVLGYLIARSDGVWTAIDRCRWIAVGAAFASYLFIAIYFSTYTGDTVPPDGLRMLQRVAWGLNQWSAIIAILGFARRHAPDGGALRPYLSDAVFPLYILHQTLIVVIARQLRPFELDPAVEGPLLIFATFGLSIAGVECIRRMRWLRPVFGMKPASTERNQTRATPPRMPARICTDI